MSDDYDDDDYYDDDDDEEEDDNDDEGDEEESDESDDDSSSSSSKGGMNVNAGNKIKILINPPPYGYGPPPGGYPPPSWDPNNPNNSPSNPPRRYPTNVFGYPYNPMLDFVFNEMQRIPLPAKNYGLVNDLFRIPIYAEGAQYLPITGRLPFPRLPALSRHPTPPPK